MSKLVYIEYPSPLKKVSCSNVETNEEVEVTSVSRGVCKDISCFPKEKGVYRMVLEFEYDPSVLSGVSSVKITGGGERTKTETKTETVTTSADDNTVSFDIPGLTTAKTNEDGTVTFSIKSSDGGTTEVNADIPGVKLHTNEDGTVSVSVPSPSPNRKVTTIKYHEEVPASFTSTTTTTTSTRSIPTKTVIGSVKLPSQQNITAKLPCPEDQQDTARADCTGPDGSQVETQCSPHDDKTVKVVFSPSLGNGIYSLNFYIADKLFPGCPIQMDVKGL